MLDNVTKKNIDDCRDILVGKVPDPKSQIEQITLALIYKFMDDMDKEAVEKYKGKAKFFTGDFEQYGWRKLFNPALSGVETIKLYSEALEKLQVNPNIPELFRNIFKNAYLPYRDPATLKLFLKHINVFNYDHSEKLGDAFEYLLSVMGSQGDAGQFRTPRHIIDFVVACVDPQKEDTILDPACGTSGFLLSGYKHILSQNTDKKAGDKLTPDHRKKLSGNFTGYDISPDMVRLSLANMYLHGFTTPNILEYDTLSSEERWDETYSVILANPPFMTPKGGIQPHKKFGVQASKAEVLFTDYIAEHLTPDGRAGIIVPNGIVSTSQAAYIQLRRQLVNDSLIAVISLPSGCFNPYSGVKTSILLLDKKLAKKSDHVMFLTIQNDGFDLGAQRREIEKNDLPSALKAFHDYKESIINNTLPDVEDYDGITLFVEKKKLLSNKHVALNGDRYLSNVDFHTKYDRTRLVDVLDYEQPTNYIVDSVDYDDNYKTPVLTAGKSFILGYTNEENGIFKDELPVIIFDDFTTATQFVDFPFKVKSSAMKILKAKKELADIRYLYYIIQKIEFNSSEHKRYWISQYSQLEIPLPPLEVQKNIVTEIEGYQRIIDGAKQVVDNYKPTIIVKPHWEKATLDELCNFIDYRGKTPNKTTHGTRLITAKNVRKGYIDLHPEEFIASEEYDAVMTRGIPQNNDVLFTTEAPLGNVALLNIDERISLAQRIILLRPKNDKIISKYLVQILLADETQKNIESYATGSTVLGIKQSSLRELEVSFPSIQEQEQIVDAIDVEMQIIEQNKKLIKLFEAKIKNKIAEVWEVREEEAQQNNAIELPSVQNNSSLRKAFGTRLINLLYNDDGFGKTKFQKVIQVGENFCCMDYETKYIQNLRGPHDKKFLDAFLEEGHENDWFRVYKNGNEEYFEKGTHSSDILQPHVKDLKQTTDKMKLVYNLFRGRDLRESELISTLYAVWNNFLINKAEFENQDLIKGVYDWSDEKAKYTEDEIMEAKKLMINAGVTPSGFGKEILKPNHPSLKATPL